MSERDFELVITRIDAVAKGVLRFMFAREDELELPEWEPGSHLDVHFVSNGVDYVRQYSLCGPVSDRRHWQVAVLLAPDSRGGSAHIHKAFSVGDKVTVTGPRNNFPLVQAKRYLFVAGGIGITPMLPMIKDAASKGADWRLLYCGRTVESMAFVESLVDFGGDKVIVHESDLKGLADLAGIIAGTDSDTEIYCCGPEPMLAAIDEICAPSLSERLHVERFSRREEGAGEADTEFEVEFVRSGVVATVPAKRSILEVAEELGVEVESSCQEGVCGSCEIRVIEGTPDHRDSVLSAKERAAGKTMMICVSRSCSARLVLDA
ncbi:ferredoxin-NADP reductase [Paraburkholderia sp. EB58]|uniref:PDR/VanB family oxidoreductase n=1 Tax=Paraburkholderia sp. EB58 TaxID=3035125 RepID=UPI003D22CC3D